MPSRILLAGLTVAALAGVGTGSALAAKLYKWVDEDGNVTYSQTKPRDREAESVKLRGVKSPDAQAQEKLEGLQDELDTRRKDREFEQADAAAVKERDERFKKNCEIARENLRVLQTSARVSATGADGQPYFLDDEARKAKLEESERQVEQFCG